MWQSPNGLESREVFLYLVITPRGLPIWEGSDFEIHIPMADQTMVS